MRSAGVACIATGCDSLASHDVRSGCDQRSLVCEMKAAREAAIAVIDDDEVLVSHFLVPVCERFFDSNNSSRSCCYDRGADRHEQIDCIVLGDGGASRIGRRPRRVRVCFVRRADVVRQRVFRLFLRGKNAAVVKERTGRVRYALAPPQPITS